ncbi:hypothetical protein ACN28E_00320 [Archangium lansingense]|uniref:hypothetical protein n=1 Tax=Archangium lansingense TaxID=2995310 RepID=UPI003B7A9FEE
MQGTNHMRAEGVPGGVAWNRDKGVREAPDLDVSALPLHLQTDFSYVQLSA